MPIRFAIALTEIPSGPVRDSELVPVPDGIDAESAVSVVLNGVTAWQLLHRAAKVRRGQTVLVHGVGGGVGILLAQLGVAAGVRVIGTASVRRHEALRDIGVELIDHRTEDVGSRVAELAPGGVDAIFDPLGPASLDRSWRLLAPGGSLHAYGSSATLHDGGPWWLPYLGLGRRLAGWELARLFGRTGGRRMRMYYVKPNTEVPDGSRGAAPNGRQWTVAAPGRLSAAAGIRGARPGLAHGGGTETGRIVLVPGLSPDRA